MGIGFFLEEEDCCRDRFLFCIGSVIRVVDVIDMFFVLRKEVLCGRDGGVLVRVFNLGWFIFRIWVCLVLFCRGRIRGMCLSGIVCRLEKFLF